MSDKKLNYYQIIWAVVLILTGVGVFYRIPQVMPTIEQIAGFADISGFIRFYFYLLGIFLIGGGCKKLYNQYKK